MTDQNLVPYLCCRGAADAIAFYAKAFGAVERERIVQPDDGRVGHAAIEVEGAAIFLADEFPEIGFQAPVAGAGTAAMLHLAFSDIDAAFERATGAGARVLEPLGDRSHGERRGKVADPFGHVWILASRAAGDDAVSALWKLADFITPMALRVAATLRIADHVSAAEGESVDALAARAGVDAGALRRLLRFLSARGLFAESEDRFTLTPIAVPFLDTHPSGTRRWLDLEGFGGTMDLAFVDLLPTVKTGRPPKVVSTTSLPEPQAASFDALMEAQSIAQAPAIVAGFDWPDSGGHVVDMGGGTGTLLVALLRARPALRGSLVELPDTAARARTLIEKTGLAGRCAVTAGDFFTTPLPERADIYMLKFVLHGLDDEASMAVLHRCRDAGGSPKSRIVVLERSLGPGEDPAQFTAMDMRMLILGEGRERTLDEFAALARKAGLRLHAATALPAGPHLIELRHEVT